MNTGSYRVRPQGKRKANTTTTFGQLVFQSCTHIVHHHSVANDGIDRFAPSTLSLLGRNVASALFLCLSTIPLLKTLGPKLLGTKSCVNISLPLDLSKQVSYLKGTRLVNAHRTSLNHTLFVKPPGSVESKM